jgi:hypothetical protein
MSAIPAIQEVEVGGSWANASWARVRGTLSERQTKSRTEGRVQVGECLPSSKEAPSSILSAIRYSNNILFEIVLYPYLCFFHFFLCHSCGLGF